MVLGQYMLLLQRSIPWELKSYVKPLHFVGDEIQNSYRATTPMRGRKLSSVFKIHEMHHECDRPVVLQSLLCTVMLSDP